MCFDCSYIIHLAKMDLIQNKDGQYSLLKYALADVMACIDKFGIKSIVVPVKCTSRTCEYLANDTIRALVRRFLQEFSRTLTEVRFVDTLTNVVNFLVDCVKQTEGFRLAYNLLFSE